MILNLRTYSTKLAARRPLVDFMLDGLRAAGCRILFTSEPSRAPFVITFETRMGERMGVVAYAFLATRTPTLNRPQDERSFQIKYGSKDDYRDHNVHDIWQDQMGLFTTLFLGIDIEEGFFVAADPEMHNPTKFFIRLEFKDQHAHEIKQREWFAWERDRQEINGIREPIEVLVGGTRDAFLDLVRFERAAKGLSQGDRQLLAERRQLFVEVPPLDSPSAAPYLSKNALHPLVEEFKLSADEILEVIASARRLKMAVRGWVAEEHLRATLQRVPGITHCERIDEEGGPDIGVRYKGGPLLTVECKNVLRNTDKDGRPRIDFQRTRAAKSNPCSRYYGPTDFAVIAGCLHVVTEQWEFRYALPQTLPPHKKCAGKIASNIVVGAAWKDDARGVFEAASALLR